MSIFEYDEEKHMRQEREESATKNLLQNIKGLMETTGWSAEEAMDKMQVSEHDREAVRPLL